MRFRQFETLSQLQSFAAHAVAWGVVAFAHTSARAEPAAAAELVFDVGPRLSELREVPVGELRLPDPGLSRYWPRARREDPLVPSDWAIAAVESAAPTGAARVPVTVAVIDTGIDPGHEDLRGALWSSRHAPGSYGYDFAHGHDRPVDLVHYDLPGCLRDFDCRVGRNTDRFLVNAGHGTHVAGHVAAVAGNAVGIRGVGAGAARVMALKFTRDFGEQNAGKGDASAAARAIDFAIEKDARIINLSWGARYGRAEADASPLRGALERAREAGLLVVVAAGNDSVDQDTAQNPAYPAAYGFDNLLVVAASDRKDQLASFSNRGARTVHLAAPGVRVLSTVPGDGYSQTVASYTDGEGVAHELGWDGTSMAAPLVSGAAAVVWSADPGAGYVRVKERLLAGARRVPGLSGRVASGGILSVRGALAAP